MTKSRSRKFADIMGGTFVSLIEDGEIQSSDVTGLHTVATSGSFNDLSDQPSPFDPSTLATVATSGAYSALSGTPTLGTASTQATGDFATAAQGTTADAALPKAGGAVTGNLLVGTTDSNPVGNNIDSGVQLGDGRIRASKVDRTILELNRKTTDGPIADFRKDGSTVGSIGSVSTDSDATSDLYIGGDNTGIRLGVGSDVSAVVPCLQTTGALRNGVTSLGSSNARFKDAHFSGTVNANSFAGDGSNLTGVGGSTDAYAVGTYAHVSRYTSTNHNIGDTTFGSNLFSWQIYSSSDVSGGTGSISLGGSSEGKSSTSFTGTWRWMSASSLTGTRSRFGIAVRIS